MTLRTWLTSFSKSKRTSTQGPRLRRDRLRLEALEDRFAPSIAFSLTQGGTGPGGPITATAGQPGFSQQVFASEPGYPGNFTFAVVNQVDSNGVASSGWELPPGLAIQGAAFNPSSGRFEVTGTSFTIVDNGQGATQAGQYNVAFIATDTQGNSGTVVYQFNVTPDTSMPYFQTSVASTTSPNSSPLYLPPGTLYQNYNATISVSNGTLSNVALLTQRAGDGGSIPDGTLISALDMTTPVPGLVASGAYQNVSTGGVNATDGSIMSGAQVAGLTITWNSTSVSIGGVPTVAVGGNNDLLLLELTAPVATLNGAINDSVMTITVNSLAGLPPSGVLRIDNELMTYTSITTGTNTVTIGQRGFGGTTAAAHVNGATVNAVQYYNFAITNSPQQIREAYGFGNLSPFDSFTGLGAGQTIVIWGGTTAQGGGDNAAFVSSFDPNFENSDLNQFNLAYPGNPTNPYDPANPNLNTFARSADQWSATAPLFIKLNGSGGINNFPSQATGDPTEVPQDIQWVHALAPLANIILLEDADAFPVKLLNDWVAGIMPSGLVGLLPSNFPVPSLVTSSWGPNSLNLSSYAPNVTYVVSSGDFAGGADSPNSNVVAAGYTQWTPSLEAAVNQGLMPTRTAGSNTFQSGGGIYASSGTQPPYQANVPNTSNHGNPVNAALGAGVTGPSVSFNGSEVSGVAVFSSLVNGGAINTRSKGPNFALGGAPWGNAWGTSIAAPSWAATLALANEARTSLGKSTLTGLNWNSGPINNSPGAQTLPILFSLAGTPAFTPIAFGIDQTTQVPAPIGTLGAGFGSPIYNRFAGLGTPRVNNLIPQLAGPQVIKSSTNLPASAGTLVLHVQNLPLNNATYSVLLSNGLSFPAMLTAPNQLTVNNVGGLTAGPLTAVVSVIVRDVNNAILFSDTSGTPVQVANVVAPIIAAGAGAGAEPLVRVFNANGIVQASFFAFEPSFHGGVRVAVGDVNGDGILDIICGAGDGGASHVKVVNGALLGQTDSRGVISQSALLLSFHAFTGFMGGVFVAAGNVNGDAADDVIVGADAGADPHVVVFNGHGGELLYSFEAFDVGFRGGVRVAAGDLDDDGVADLIAGAGPGADPHVVAFSLAGGTVSQFLSFEAYEADFTGGVYVASRQGKIATGRGAGSSEVRIFDGATAARLADFFAFSGFTGGACVGWNDLGILAGPTPGGSPLVNTFDAETQAQLSSFFAFEAAFLGGVFVAG